MRNENKAKKGCSGSIFQELEADTVSNIGSISGGLFIWGVLYQIFAVFRLSSQLSRTIAEVCSDLRQVVGMMPLKC